MEGGKKQGGIISPLLSNLILHEFDKYIEKLIIDRESLNDKKKELLNPIYSRLTKQKDMIRKEMATSSQDDLKDLRKKFRKILRERNRYKKKIPNPSWIRLEYVRYADD